MTFSTNDCTDSNNGLLIFRICLRYNLSTDKQIITNKEKLLLEKKNFKKYFTQGKFLLYAGILIVAAGLLLYGINYLFVHEWVLYQGSWIIATVGAVTVICHFSMRVRDGAVDEYAHGFHKVLEQELEEYFNESEKRPVKVYNFTTGGYALDDSTAIKLVAGGDQTPRCEKYSGVALLYSPEKLYAVFGTLDLINGDTRTEKLSLPLGEILSVESSDHSFTKAIKGKNKYCECFKMHIKTEKYTYSFLVHNDAVTDEAVAKISRAAESKRQ